MTSKPIKEMTPKEIRSFYVKWWHAYLDQDPLKIAERVHYPASLPRWKTYKDEARLQVFPAASLRSGSGDAPRRKTAHVTASVHVGARSNPGTSFATMDGRNTQCQPIKTVRIMATTTSTASLSGDSAPSKKNGNKIT